MATPSNKNLQTEVDACFLYNKLADAETDATVANVFRQMSAIEKSHAEAFLKKLNRDSSNKFPPLITCPRLAITSLPFILLCVPEPVCQITNGNSASN